MAAKHGVRYESKYKEGTKKSKRLEKVKQKQKTDFLAMTEISQLASWHCAVLAKHVVTGMPLGPLAKEIKHSSETINAVAKSEAGRKYMKSIEDSLHDPILTARNLMASGVVNKLLDWEQMWQLAVESRDYEAVHRMAKDIGLQPIMDNKQQGPTKIQITLGTDTLGSIPAQTSFQVVEQPDFEIEEDDDNEV